jgi:ketosteroid isomerase-like protein
MFSPVLVEIHLMQVSKKGDFAWALVSCAAAGQKTGSHWTQVAGTGVRRASRVTNRIWSPR